MASSGCFAAAEDLLPVFQRRRRDVSAPAGGLTGVRWVSAGWLGHVSISRLVCRTPRKDIRQAPHCQRPTTFLTHPLVVSDEDPRRERP